MKVFIIKDNTCKEIKLTAPTLSLWYLVFPTELRWSIAGFTALCVAVPMLELWLEQDKRKIEKKKKEIADHKFQKEYQAMLNDKKPKQISNANVNGLFEDEEAKEKIEEAAKEPVKLDMSNVF